MSRIKINDLAKQLGVEVSTIITKAKELGARPKGVTSSVEDVIAFKIRASIGVKKGPKRIKEVSSLQESTEQAKTSELISDGLDDEMAKALQDAEAALNAVEEKSDIEESPRKSLLPRKKPAPLLRKKIPKKKPLPLNLQKDLDKKNREKAEAKARAEEELRLKAEAAERQRLEIEAEQKLKAEEEARIADEQARIEAKASQRAKIEAEAKAKVEAASKAKVAASKITSETAPGTRVKPKKKPRKKPVQEIKPDAIDKIKVIAEKPVPQVAKPKKVEGIKPTRMMTKPVPGAIPKIPKQTTTPVVAEKPRHPVTHQNPDVLAKLPKTAEPVKVEVSKPKKVSPIKLPPIPKERLEKLKQPLRPPPGFTRSRGSGRRFTSPPPSTPPPAPPPTTAKRKKDYSKERDKLRRDREVGATTGKIPTEPYVVGRQHFLIKKKTRKRKSVKGEFVPPIPKKPTKLTIEVFSKTAGIPEKRVMTFMLKNGIVPNPEEELKGDILAILSKEFGLETSEEGKLSEENLIPRSPIVTVMGHVDHGKTTLLDFIRKASVAEGEAGGITQSIGSYKVQVGNRSIVFIDTPGHEAFSAMRQEGANVTDVVILVVAATEGIKEQTKEAINMARKAKVSIVVAANKMDLPGANLDRLKGELAKIDLTPEDWGGSTIVVPISAKKGDGVAELLEMVSLQTDILELKMNKSGKLAGTVIESHMDKFVGPLATVIIQCGSLKVGDYIEAGTSWGRVKALYDDHGKRIKKAECVSPIKVMGFDSVPKPGQVLLASDKSRKRKTEKKASADFVPEHRDIDTPTSLEELFAAYEREDATKLNVVIKTDSQGSLDAVKFALSKIKIKDVPVNIVYSGIGVIGDNDILLSEASDALLIGFNVLPEPKTKKVAKQKSIRLMTFNIIFELTDAVTEALKALVKPEFQDILIGKAEVREIFNIGGVGNIAGCLVHEGKIRKDAKVKLMRNRIQQHEAPVEALKHFKEDVTEVKSGYECGIRLKDYEDIKTGDILEFYEVKEVE